MVTVKILLNFLRSYQDLFLAGGGVGWEVNNKEQIYINVTLHIFLLKCHKVTCESKLLHEYDQV